MPHHEWHFYEVWGILDYPTDEPAGETSPEVIAEPSYTHDYISIYAYYTYSYYTRNQGGPGFLQHPSSGTAATASRSL